MQYDIIIDRVINNLIIFRSKIPNKNIFYIIFLVFQAFENIYA